MSFTNPYSPYNDLFIAISQQGNSLQNEWYNEQFAKPLIAKAGAYQAGEKIEIDVYYGTFIVPYGNDYTVKVYSKPAYEVVDAEGKTNMIHMDGSEPGGFTKSTYKGYSGAKGVAVTKKVDPNTKPP